MSRRVLVLLAVCLIPLWGAACSEAESAAVPFSIQLSPEFVQGAIPGAATGVLATVRNESPTDEPVELSASAEGAQVSIQPSRINEGDVAEVSVVPGPADAERPLQIIVIGNRGELEAEAVRSTTVMAWEDDRGEYARTLLGLFTSWLEDNEPELGIDPATEFSGSYVAPGLLVVSHYLFMSEDWELGLSWHVMVAPDDWAEIYLRPRSELTPTMAFRMQSQTAALESEAVDIQAVSPPAEVVR